MALVYDPVSGRMREAAPPARREWTPGGGGQFVGGTPSNVPGGTSQPGSPPPAVFTPPPPKDDPRPAPNGGSPAPAAGLSAAEVQRLIDAALARQAADQKAQKDREAVAFLGDILEQYGMGELKDSINGLVQQWGNSSSVIMNNLRQTDSYKSRFKGLLSLQQKGITDVRNEAEYIGLESSYRQVFRDAGLQSYIGTAGSAPERDAIAKLVGDYSLSVNEVKARIGDAARVVATQTPTEVKDALQRYYNVAPSDLVAYTLDKNMAKDRINEMANAAIVGGLSSQVGLNAERGTAEQIAMMTAGNEDLNGAALAPRFAQAKDVFGATKRLAEIENSDLSTDEALQSEFDFATGAKKKVKDLQSRERARFSGTSAIQTGSLSRSTGV